MTKKDERIDKALDILYDYKGGNPYIHMVKRDIYVLKKQDSLTDFKIDFILENKDVEPIPINKITKIPDWYGENRQEAWGLDFVPEKLKIVSYMGEADGYYCCYVKYRQTADPVMCFIPKNAVINNFFVEDYHDYKIDFNRYDNLSTSIDPNRVLKEHQKEAVQFLLSRKRCILADDMGLGKMEPNSSMIPTINGFKRMGDICVGDIVFGSDGKPCNVLKIFPHKDKEIYRVTFTDDTYVDCGIEHLWVVRDNNMITRNKGWKVLSLKDIIENGIYSGRKRKIYKYQIPTANQVQYYEKNYQIHPYILGMCIGDGNMCNDGINISIPDSEIESVQRIENLLDDRYTLSYQKTNGCPRYKIRKKVNNNKSNIYYEEIKRLGLNVHGNHKFIPDEYKYGSISQRLDLLRGLMDSDGSITEKNNKIVFSTKSQKLANDICELVFSLGGIGRIHSYQHINKGLEYQVLIQIKDNPFYLKRKRDRYKPTFKKYCTKRIKSVEYNRNEDATCLMVNSCDNTYLTSKNYVVTHNTCELSVAAIEGNFDSVLIICPASLKQDWKRELMWYVPEKDITVIEGGFETMNKTELQKFLGYPVGKTKMKRAELIKEAQERGKWCENRFVIVNYDILDEFYDFSRGYTDEAKQRILDNSPILKFIHKRKSCLIVDEAHRLSNCSSKRYKAIKGLIKKGNPECVFLATGTPITNNPLNLFYILNLIENQVTCDIDSYKYRYCDAKLINCPGEYEKWREIYLVAREEKKRGESEKFFDPYCYSVKIIDYVKENMSEILKSLTREERDEMRDYIKEHTRKILKADGAINLDELKECISHLYLRRTKEDVGSLPNKNVHEVFYNLTEQQQYEYDKLWDEYEEAQLNSDPEKELNKDLLEGGIYRRYLSNEMVSHTIALADKILQTENKVIIATCYDEELYTLRDYYGKRAVIINGKCTPKEKEKSKYAFINNPDVNVLIGNIEACSMGLTLIVSHTLIFNNLDWTAALNNQMMDRIHRIGQTKECNIYIQLFKKTQYEHMWNVVLKKQMISENVIKSENQK